MPAVPTKQHWRFTPLLLAVLLAVFVGIVVWTLRSYQGLPGFLGGGPLSNSFQGYNVTYGIITHGDTTRLEASTHGIFMCPQNDPANATWLTIDTFSSIPGIRIYEYDITATAERNLELPRNDPLRWPGKMYGFSGRANTLTAFQANKIYYVYADQTFDFGCSVSNSSSVSSPSGTSSSASATPVDKAFRIMDWNNDQTLTIFEARPYISRMVTLLGKYDPGFDMNDDGLISAIDLLSFYSAQNIHGVDPTNSVQVYLPLEEGTGSIIKGGRGNKSEISFTNSGAVWSRTTSLTGSLFALNFPLAPATFIEASDNTIADFGINDAFSVSAWVRPQTVGPVTIASKFTQDPLIPANQLGWVTRINLQRPEILFYGGEGHLLQIRSNNAIVSGTTRMNHVFFTYDGNGTASGVHMYVNGAEHPLVVITDTLNGVDFRSTGNLTIGSQNANGTLLNRFRGYMDDIAILSGVHPPNVTVADFRHTCGDNVCIGDEREYCWNDCNGNALCGDGECDTKEVGVCYIDCSESTSCTDTESGQDGNIRGKVTRDGQTPNPLLDGCYGKDVWEYHCTTPENGIYGIAVATCANGCAYGACR